MSFIAAQENLTVRQVAPDTPSGDVAWAAAFTFYQNQALTTPLNLTGYTAEFIIGPPANLEFTSSGAQVSITPLSGIVSVYLTVAQVNAVFASAKPGYFLQLTDQYGNVGIPVNGVLYWAAPDPGGLGI